MGIARVGILGILALVGCKSSMKGKLELTTDGAQVDIKSAFYVPAGTDTFRVHVSSVNRDCAWAERQALGFMESGETHGSFDFAPVIDSTGASHWRVVGAGWTGPTSGNVGAVAWPADVATSTNGDQHIKVDTDANKHIHLHGEFDVIRCGAPPPPHSAPATVKVGGKTFPLTVASAKQLEDKSWSVRVSRDLRPCSDEVTGADLFFDFYADADFHAATSFLVQGNVLPPFGYQNVHDPAAVPTIARTGEVLVLDGVVHTRELGAIDGPALDFEVHGKVPLTACPGPH